MLKKTTRGMTAGMTRRGVGFAVAGGGPTPLDILASVGTSTSPTSTGTKAVTGVGFEPKVVMPFGTAALGSTANVQAVLGLGVGTSSTNRATISVQSVHNVATSDADRGHDNANIFNNIGSVSVFQEADLDSLDADGFTLDWSTVSATARILNHICLGGADLEVSLTQHQMNNTNAPQSFAHGLSGAPTGLLLFSAGNAAAPPNTQSVLAFNIGIYSNSLQLASFVYSSNGSAITSAKKVLLDNCVMSLAGVSISRSMSISSVDSTNINCTYSGAGTYNPYFWMLAICGAKCQVGTFDCNGSTSPLTISTTGITPKLFLPVFVPGGVDNINTVQNGNALTIGASDGTNTVSCGITDADNVSTTNARRYQDSTGLSEYDFDGTLESDSSVSFSGESVVLDPSTNTGTTWAQGAYLVIGS